MNKILAKQLRKYYRDIKKFLSGKTTRRYSFIHSLKLNVEDYIADNSITHISEIYNQFGTAEEIAEAYLAEMSSLDLTQNLRRLKFFRICATFIILGMICFFIAFVHELRQGYPTEVEIILQEESTT